MLTYADWLMVKQIAAMPWRINLQKIVMELIAEACLC